MEIKLTIILFDFNNFKLFRKVSNLLNIEEFYVLEKIIDSNKGISIKFKSGNNIEMKIYEPNMKKPDLLIWQKIIHDACGISLKDMYIIPVCPGNQTFRKLFNNEQWTIAMEMCDDLNRQVMADNHNMPFNTMKKRVARVYTLADIPGFDNLSNHEKGVRFIEFMIEMGVFIKPDWILNKTPF
jgi:hypothetical protein